VTMTTVNRVLRMNRPSTIVCEEAIWCRLYYGKFYVELYDVSCFFLLSSTRSLQVEREQNLWKPMCFFFYNENGEQLGSECMIAFVRASW
jgi:hypothetical protein